MKFEIPNYVSEPMELLEKNGYECFIVGGAIRNILLGLPVHDYDLTTNALPAEMKSVFHHYKTIDTGIAHGTVTILSHHVPLEITTYRKDSTYEDHRHPDTVSFTPDLKEDCARRDFTINALCYNASQGLQDFYNGQTDLNNHMIRCIGDPYQRFNEDSLRILRAIRFASQLDFKIADDTSKSLIELAQQLTYVSQERIHDEFMKFLSFSSCGKLLHQYRDVIAVFLPELQKINSFDDICNTISNPDLTNDIRLSILLSHLTIEEIHTALRRLKFDNHTIQFISTCVRHKEIPFTNKIDVKYALKQINISFTDFLTYYKTIHHIDNDDINTLYHDILANNEVYCLKQLAVNGNDLVQLGYKGPDIAKHLDHLLNLVIEEKCTNDKDSLLQHLQ